MRLVITGAEGLIGAALVQAATAAGHHVTGLARAGCELAHREEVLRVIKAAAPDIVVHSAAKTNIEWCEANPEQCYRDNVLATQNIALACAEVGCALGYISAGLVFDGTKPYPEQYYEFDTPNPSSVYARSKFAGELFAQTLLRRFYIIRTSWVFGPRVTSGKLNFVESVLQQARANKPVSLVTDRWMNPTYLPDLTAAVLQLVETGAYGIYHLVNEGVVSPLDFGHAIFQRLGTHPQINALKQSDFPAKAPPVYNVGLNNFAAAENLNIRLRRWQDALVDYLHLIA